MRFYCTKDPEHKMLLISDPSRGTPDVYLSFVGGVCDTDSVPEEHRDLAVGMLRARAEKRKDIFGDDDPDFAQKIYEAQGVLSPGQIKASLQAGVQAKPDPKMVYACAWCGAEFGSKEDFMAHISSEHVKNLAEVEA